jgi:hypothetical protein
MKPGRKAKLAGILLVLALAGVGFVVTQVKERTVSQHTRPEKHHHRLASEKSPYLLQHAANPVDWYPWGPEAFERARKDDKPVFLSIG